MNVTDYTIKYYLIENNYDSPSQQQYNKINQSPTLQIHTHSTRLISNT